jgi:hypothetical protein
MCDVLLLLAGPGWTGEDWGGDAMSAPNRRFLINTVLDSAATPITLLMNFHPEAEK